MRNIPVAFIRKSDGEIYAKHPDKPNRWVNSKLYSMHKQFDGYEFWTTELFLSYCESGSFEAVWSKYDIETVSEFYKKQKEFNEIKIKYQEQITGLCSKCQMALHNCLCSHDD